MYPHNSQSNAFNSGIATNVCPQKATPLIEVNAVSVTMHETTVLSATSFHIAAGQIVSLHGKNGAGKSTLLRALSGRITPTSGHVRVNGQPADERSTRFRRSVATMLALPPMASDLTMFDHLALVSSTWEDNPRSVELRVQHVLHEFGLTALAARYPSELSSGQTQLFGLALTFIRPFEVLLLDEPEQRLDPVHVELLAQAMLARQSTGATIVAATHSEILTARTANITITLEAAR